MQLNFPKNAIFNSKTAVRMTRVCAEWGVVPSALSCYVSPAIRFSRWAYRWPWASLGSSALQAGPPSSVAHAGSPCCPCPGCGRTRKQSLLFPTQKCKHKSHRWCFSLTYNCQIVKKKLYLVLPLHSLHSHYHCCLCQWPVVHLMQKNWQWEMIDTSLLNQFNDDHQHNHIPPNRP